MLVPLIDVYLHQVRSHKDPLSTKNNRKKDQVKSKALRQKVSMSKVAPAGILAMTGRVTSLILNKIAEKAEVSAAVGKNMKLRTTQNMCN